MRDLILLLTFFLPVLNIFPKSFNALMTLIGHCEDAKPQKHYYSKEFKKKWKRRKPEYEVTYIGTKPPRTKGKNIKFFYEHNVSRQISDLFQNHKLGERIRKSAGDNKGVDNSSPIRDVTDGTEYFRVNKNREQYDLTLEINTDGLNLSKSSGIHCWPVFARICELPVCYRNAFTIFLGLWCDNIKPNMQIFLKPICEQLERLNGITWFNASKGKKEFTKVRCALITADAPARAEILNVQQFNGRFGCNNCEKKSKKIKKNRNMINKKKKKSKDFPVL